MPDEPNLSPTRPDSGYGQSSANQTSEKKDGEPKKELSPTENSWERIFELGGTGLCFWVWAEIVGCHSLLTLCFLAATLTVFHAGPCLFIYKLIRKHKWSFNCSLGLWVCVTLAAWLVVWVNSRPLPTQPKPFPSPFNSGLSLIIPESSKVTVLDTNSTIQLDTSRCIMLNVMNGGIPTSHITIEFITPLNRQEIDFDQGWRLNLPIVVNHPANANSAWNNWVMIDNGVLAHNVCRMYGGLILISPSFKNRTFPAQIWLSSDNTLV